MAFRSQYVNNLSVIKMCFRFRAYMRVWGKGGKNIIPSSVSAHEYEVYIATRKQQVAKETQLN